MTNGRADFLDLGNWNAICYQCGRKRKASDLRRQWQGYYVCKEEWEPRNAQDFVRGVPDLMVPPWTQPPPADIFVTFCTPNGRTAIANTAVANCAIANFIDPLFDPSITN